MDGGEAEAAAGGGAAFDAVTARLLGLTVLSPSEAEPAAGDGAEEAAPGDGDAEDALDGASDGDDGGGSEADEAEEETALPGAAVASPADRSASLRAARATTEKLAASWPAGAYAAHDGSTLLHHALATVLTQRLAPRPEDEARCGALLQWLAGLLSTRFTGVSLALFGSAVSRLHSRGSDVDVSLLVQRGTKFRPADDAPPGDHAAARRRLLGALTRELQRVPLRIDDVLFLPHARVPLVKFVDRRSGTACDVCVANDGVFKSGVLGLLAARQPLFQALVRLVKAWAKGAGINDPAAGTLNSFALALMCAFHCQTGVNPPLLPPLAALLCDAPEVALAEEAARAAAGDIKAGPLRREIDAGRDFAAAERRAAALPDAAFGSGAAPPSLAALTASFFAHWAAALPSLAAGAVLRPFAAAWGTGGAWGAAKAYSMAVEDAFDASENPARSLYRGAQFERVASAVRGAAQALAVPPAGPGALRALAEALFGDETAFEEGTDAELRVPPRGPLVVSPAPGRGRGRGRGAGRGAGGRGARRDRGGGREGMPPQAPPPPPQQQQTMMPPPPPLFSAAPTRGIYSAVPPPPPGPAPPAGGRRIPAPRPMPVAQAAAPDGGAPVTAAPPRRQRAPRADADGAAPAVPRRPRQRSAGRNAGQPGDAPPAA